MTTIPLLNTGFPVVITIQGCESELSLILPPNSTQARAQAAADLLIQQAAEQQARCDAIPLTTGRQPARVNFSALQNYFCLEDVFNQTVVASTTPPSPPYAYTVGAKPAWMNAVVSPAGVVLSGTPPAAGAYSVTIGVTSSGGTGAHTYTFNFVEINDSSPLPAATKDDPYSIFLDGSDIPGILAWGISAGSLPTGLSLDASTGEISGTPTVEETASFTVSVTNGDLACSKDFELEVQAVSICGATPQNVQDAIWVPIGPNPACGSLNIVAGVCASWSREKNTTTCPTASLATSTTICNPGAAYDITVTIPWDSFGSLAPSASYNVNFVLLINAVVVATASNDLRFSPFTEVLVGSLPTGINTVQLNISVNLAALPNPSFTIISNGALTITPLVHP